MDPQRRQWRNTGSRWMVHRGMVTRISGILGDSIILYIGRNVPDLTRAHTRPPAHLSSRSLGRQAVAQNRSLTGSNQWYAVLGAIQLHQEHGLPGA